MSWNFHTCAIGVAETGLGAIDNGGVNLPFAAAGLIRSVNRAMVGESFEGVEAKSGGVGAFEGWRWLEEAEAGRTRTGMRADEGDLKYDNFSRKFRSIQIFEQKPICSSIIFLSANKRSKRTKSHTSFLHTLFLCKFFKTLSYTKNH